MLCCIDLGTGIHYSQRLICNLTLASEPSEPSASNFRSMSTSHRQPPHPHINMPRPRQRMRSKRGSSRGRLQCSSPSTASESSSPSSNYLSAYYLATHSGRGHTRTVRPLPLQTRPFASASPSSPQQANHPAQFTYHCTLNRPIITAIIIVMFQEEPPRDEGRPT